MGSIFFIADTHFKEDKIRLYESRPFDTAHQMDEEIIKRWNNTVQEEDRIYVLGDFGGDQAEVSILERLKGSKYLVKGNHDIYSNEYYRNAGFQEVYDHPIILDGFWILSHEPVYVNKHMPYANLFGHVHNSPIIRTYSSQHYCVSVERIEYTPVKFEEIAEKIKLGQSNVSEGER